MEDKITKLEQQLNELENSNIISYIDNIKKIKKNAIKLENDINKILSENNDSESENEEEINIDDIDIDKELNSYSQLVTSLDNDDINNKTIEELNIIYKKILKIEKMIIEYQTLKCELNEKYV